MRGRILNSRSIALVVNHSHCTLPGTFNEYFSFDDIEGTNIEEGVARLPYRVFFPRHPQWDEFIERLGAEQTFLFSRVLLSYYDAAYMLFTFTARYRSGKDLADISFEDIEGQAQGYNIDDFNYSSLDYETFLGLYDRHGDRVLNSYSFSHNNLQELFWAMNMEKLLTSQGISYYPNRTFTLDEQKTNNFSLLTYKMLKVNEVGMVMHTWRKLNSYNNSDFINNVSNILEFIEKDLGKNINTFNTQIGELPFLQNLIKLVSKTRREFYFGLFNNSELLGFLSRHGSKSLINYNKMSNNTELKMKVIRDRMLKGIIPNQREIQYMLNVWHYTTSLIVTIWFRLKKTNKR